MSVSDDNLEVRTIFEHVIENIKAKNWHHPTSIRATEPPFCIHGGGLTTMVPRSFLEKVVELINREGYQCRLQLTAYAAGPYWAFVIDALPRS